MAWMTSGELGSPGGVGTHSGNACLLVVAHAPVHCSYDEDVFSLGLTIKQGGGGDFTCGREVHERGFRWAGERAGKQGERGGGRRGGEHEGEMLARANNLAAYVLVRMCVWGAVRWTHRGRGKGTHALRTATRSGAV